MTTQEIIKDALSISKVVKALEFGQDILDRVPGLMAKFHPGRKAIVVADKNTWRVAGEKVYEELQKASIPTVKFIFEEDHFHADWKYIVMLDEVLDKEDGVFIAVGSGVINDLCKLSSHRHGQQYICVATAASVDGFTSATASISDERGAKCSFKCAPPAVIVADMDVLAPAPFELNAAGYADLAAKVTAGAEWMIADLFGTEPLHAQAWSLTQDNLKAMLADPDGIRNGNPESVEQVFLGLTLCGVGIEASGGDTRCVSCAEHLYNHYLDMTHHEHNGLPVSHGFQVAVGELVLCAFFDELLKMDLTRIDVDKCVEAWPSLESEQKRAMDIFADFPVPTLGYEEITKKWNTREEVRVQLQRVKDTWPEFREKLAAQVYSFETMRELFKRAGAPTCAEDIGLTNAKLRKMTDYVQLMRYRINVLDLAKRAGFYDELVGKVFGKGGAFEI